MLSGSRAVIPSQGPRAPGLDSPGGVQGPGWGRSGRRRRRSQLCQEVLFYNPLLRVLAGKHTLSFFIKTVHHIKCK